MKLKLRLGAAVTTVFVPITCGRGYGGAEGTCQLKPRSDAAAQGVIRP
jgi:hypothetical protein